MRLLFAFDHWLAYQMAITMRCPYCREAFTGRDSTHDNSGQRYHAECFMRMIAGSARHQLGQCSCYDPDAPEEEPLTGDLTIRKWARRATAMFQILRGRSPHDPAVVAEVTLQRAAQTNAYQA